jgi:S1-C subfamily serine protease
MVDCREVDLPDSIDVVRPSVIQIRMGIPGTHGDRVIGTGFLVHKDGYALTARHVAEFALSIQKENPEARLWAGLAIPNLESAHLTIRASFALLDLAVVEEDRRHDLALLRLSPNPFATGKPSGVARTAQGLAVNALFGLAQTDEARPRDGASVAVSGYPLNEPTLVTTSGCIASAWGTDVQEVQPPGAPAGFTIPDVKDSYLADVAVNPGNSGGPVYMTATAKVIGVCVAFRIASTQGGNPFSYNSGLSVVVPVTYGLALLRKQIDLASGGS